LRRRKRRLHDRLLHLRLRLRNRPGRQLFLRVRLLRLQVLPCAPPEDRPHLRLRHRAAPRCARLRRHQHQRQQPHIRLHIQRQQSRELLRQARHRDRQRLQRNGQQRRVPLVHRQAPLVRHAPQALHQRVKDFLRVRASPRHIRIVRALHKECDPRLHRARFVPAVRRDRAVHRDPAVLRRDFRSVPVAAVPEMSRLAASGRVQRAAFPRLNRESRCTRASRPRRADVRQSKKDTRKASDGFIRFARALEQERAAPRMWSRLLRFSASRAR
jgi:hypothetical protein